MIASETIPMTIRYKNTFRDVMAFCFYHYPRTPFVIGFYGIGFGLVSVATFRSLPADLSPVAKIITFLIIELILFVLIAGGFAITVVLSMVSRRNKTVLTEHTLTVADGSFVEETAYNKTDYKWAGVQKLARTRSYVFIYISQHAAHVLPRRAFQNDAEWHSFYDFCKHRIETVAAAGKSL
jgi:hypothetical protein